MKLLNVYCEIKLNSQKQIGFEYLLNSYTKEDCLIILKNLKNT